MANPIRTHESQRDENAVIGGVSGKKVFVIDNVGNQITSFGANATITPLQAWPDPKTFIGLVTTILGSMATVTLGTKLDSTNDSVAIGGNVTLDPGSFTGIKGNVTLSDPKGFIGLVTVTGSLAIGGNVTLNPSPNFIGLVSIQPASFNYANYVSNTTVTTKSGPGMVHTLVINTRGTGSNAVLYDSLLPSGNKIATVDTTLSTTAFVYDASFATGLTLAMAGAGAADLTVTFK